jgi:hypothetical protein
VNPDLVSLVSFFLLSHAPSPRLCLRRRRSSRLLPDLHCRRLYPATHLRRSSLIFTDLRRRRSSLSFPRSTPLPLSSSPRCTPPLLPLIPWSTTSLLPDLRRRRSSLSHLLPDVRHISSSASFRVLASLSANSPAGCCCREHY